MSQVAFTVDDALKAAAMKKSKQMWVPLKVILQYCMQAFVQGKISLGIQVEPTFSSTQEEIAYYDVLGSKRLNEARKENGYYERIFAWSQKVAEELKSNPKYNGLLVSNPRSVWK